MKALTGITLLLIAFTTANAQAGDSLFMRVHFLYGSKPLKAYRTTEPKWFGGMLGGHAGIEGDSNQVLNFIPHGKFHVFARKKEPHSLYMEHSVRDFYRILGSKTDSVKKTIIRIPISTRQKQQFDSLSNCYLKTPPYDYALFGMRCGAATYEILAKLNILPAYGYGKTWRKILYPRKLRKRLLKLARQKGWQITTSAGVNTRKWEQD